MPIIRLQQSFYSKATPQLSHEGAYWLLATQVYIPRMWQILQREIQSQNSHDNSHKLEAIQVRFWMRQDIQDQSKLH